jgi:transcriptional regulator with XRE-family HTH domain
MTAITKSPPSSSPQGTNRVLSPTFWRAWLRRPTFDVAEAVIRLRRLRGISQADLARRMGTQQPAIARLESGEANVRLSTLRELAVALDATVRIELEPFEMVANRIRNSWWKQLEESLVAAHQTRILHQSIDTGFSYQSTVRLSCAKVHKSPLRLQSTHVVRQDYVETSPDPIGSVTQVAKGNEETKAS